MNEELPGQPSDFRALVRELILFRIKECEPEGVPLSVLVSDVIEADPSIRRKVIIEEIDRLLMQGEIHSLGSKAKGTQRYRLGPVQATKETKSDTLTTNDVLSDTDQHGKDIKFFLRPRTEGGKPKPILLLIGDDYGPLIQQSLLHMKDRGYYCSPAREIVKLNKDVFKKNAEGKPILQMKESIALREAFLRKQLGNLFPVYQLVPRDPEKGPGPDEVAYIGYGQGSLMFGWEKILIENGQYPELPFLQGIAEFRFYTEGGTLVHKVGYDEIAETLYLPREAELPIDIRPNLDAAGQLAHAKTLAAEVMDLFSQFPFETEADRAAYLALILTATMRPALNLAPLFGIDATTRGSGKTILAQMAIHIATGGPPATLPWRGNVEEQEKTLNSALLTSAVAELFDNIPTGSTLGGALLDAILTSERVDVRKLGGQVVPNVSTRKTFIATGNGLTPSTDMPRRMIMIRLTPRMENPENRKDLKIPNLEDFIREHAREINAKILGICEAFRLAGRPDMVATLGLDPFLSFNGSWTKYVRNCVLWLGMADPYATRVRITERDAHADFRTRLFKYLRDRLEKNPHGLPFNTIMDAEQLQGFFPEEWVDARTGKADRRLEKGLKAMAGTGDKIGRVGNVEGVEYTLKTKEHLNRPTYYVEKLEPEKKT